MILSAIYIYFPMKWEYRANLLFPILLFILQKRWAALAVPQVPCYFIFGDSMADNGNNSPLTFATKADFLPYGIDFLPTGPTGRFCNGLTVVDIVGKLLGFDNYIPPYHPLTITNIMQGVNYASGGAGISEDTGVPGTRTTMKMQLRNHRTIAAQILSELGIKGGHDHLSKCIYSISLGSSDYLDNFNGLYPIFQPDPEKFASDLIKQYHENISRLYNSGARKFALYGLMHLGCTPYEISTHKGPMGTGCVDSVSVATDIFNEKLKSLVEELNNSPLIGATFTYINAYAEIANLLDDPVTTDTCCQLAVGSFSCFQFGRVCISNRNSTVFFDALNPTEYSNWVVAEIAYKARSSDDAYPYDISELATI